MAAKNNQKKAKTPSVGTKSKNSKARKSGALKGKKTSPPKIKAKGQSRGTKKDNQEGKMTRHGSRSERFSDSFEDRPRNNYDDRDTRSRDYRAERRSIVREDEFRYGGDRPEYNRERRSQDMDIDESKYYRGHDRYRNSDGSERYRHDDDYDPRVDGRGHGSSYEDERYDGRREGQRSNRREDDVYDRARGPRERSRGEGRY